MVLGFWQAKVRPLLEKHPGIVLGIVGVGAIASAVFGLHSCMSGSSPIVTGSAYFTCDDGKTLFEDDDPHDVPPFQHGGQEAVRVFFIPGRTIGRTDSIWYLSKMTDGQKTQMETMTANGPGPGAPSPVASPGKGPAVKSPSPFGGQLIKRPGDAEWIPMGDPKAGEVLKLPG